MPRYKLLYIPAKTDNDPRDRYFTAKNFKDADKQVPICPSCVEELAEGQWKEYNTSTPCGCEYWLNRVKYKNTPKGKNRKKLRKR